MRNAAFGRRDTGVPDVPPSAYLDPRDPAARRLLTALFIGVFMSALDTAVIAPAVPALRAAFTLDNRQISLITVIFILGSMPSTVLMANLGDRHGRRPVYLACSAVFALGSLMIAASTSFWMVLAGRAVQGIGAGGLMPTASAIIGDTFAPEQRGRVLGLVGATYGMAFVIGPPLATLLMLAASWHWIFLINLPIAAVVLFLSARALPARAPAAGPAALDLAGIVALFGFLVALVLGITRAADPFAGAVLWPWLLAAAAALLAVLVAIEGRASQPMVPLRLFGNRQLATTYLLTAGAGFGMGAIAFLSLIATLAHGVAPKMAGFALLPMVICSMIGSMAAGRGLNRYGARRLIVAGFALLAVGYGGSAAVGLGLWGYLLFSVPVGIGVGVVVGGALRSIAIDEAPVAVRGAAQGLINLCSSVGTLLAASCIGAVADFQGGGSGGFAIAYAMVAGTMLLMMVIALGLRPGAAGHAPEGEATLELRTDT
jgi:MFS family permease